MKAKLIKTVDGYELFTQGFLKGSTNHKLIDSLNIEEGSIRYKLSLKNCQSIERGYDLDELAMAYDLYENINFVGQTRAYKSGFQKSIELNGDKLFTLDDIYTVFIMGREGMEDKMNRYVTRIHEPTEWDIEIEMEKVKDETKIIGSVKGVKGSGHKITTYRSTPKLDSDGCLILKRI